MLEQDVHHGIGRGVVACVEAQLLEVLVLANQLRRIDGEQGQEARQLLPARGRLEVLDDVELDVARAQDFQRAT